MSRILVLAAGVLAAGLTATSVPAQIPSGGPVSTSPGSGPTTGGSYSPGNPLPPIVTTPIGGSMSSSTYGSVGSSQGGGSLSNSGTGARSGAGSVTGRGSSSGSGTLDLPGGSAVAQSSPGSTQAYVDQAELARCNGMAGAAREDCVGKLRDRMDMNSGVGARSAPGGRIGTGNGVGIAPGNRLPRPMTGPTLPAAPNPPMGPASGGLPQSPLGNPVTPLTPIR